MELVRLNSETDIGGFDCGDTDLNNFLVEDAKKLPRQAYCNIIRPC